MDLRQWLSLLVLAATVTAVVLRPRRPGEGGAALIGAGAVLVLGLLPPDAAIDTLRRDLDLLAFFLGLMLLAQGAEQVGLFSWLAWAAVRAAGGSARRLFVIAGLVGTLTTAIFSNDAATLLLTPAVLAATAEAEEAQQAFALTATFIADFASATLPVANPVNLLALERLHVGLGDYLLHVSLPGLAAAVVTLAACRRRFRGPLERAGPVSAGTAPPDNPLRRPAAIVLGCLGPAYLVFALLGLPLGAVTLAAGTGLAVPAAVRLHNPWRAAVAGVSWQAMGLILGLLLVVASVSATGAADRLGDLLTGAGAPGPLACLISAALVVGLLANVMNNWPAMLLAVGIIGSGRLGAGAHAATYGAVLGADLGGKLTTVGSLATVLWLTLLRKRGVKLSRGTYWRNALVVTPPELAAALLTAALLLRL